MDNTHFLPCQHTPSFFSILIFLPFLVFALLTFLFLVALLITVALLVFPLRLVPAPRPVCTS